MGAEQIDGMEDFHFVNFSAGWYPEKNRSDIPLKYYTGKGRGEPGPIGFNDVQHTIWFEGNLRKWFGYQKIGAQVGSGSNGGGIGFAYWPSENTQFQISGTTFYENAAGTWTDRTGAVTITNDTLWTFKAHVIGANRYVIGGNGTDPMIRWDGAGNNLSALGGSPLAFQSFDYMGGRWWGARAGQNTVHGSDETNPASNWNASGIVFNFQNTVYGVQDVGSWLAVVKRNAIGAISGFGPSSFQKEESIINVGSPAHRTFAKGQYATDYGQQEGFYMVAWDGPYFITESKQAIPLGNKAVREWWNRSGNINKSTLYKSVGCWNEFLQLYVFVVPVASDLWPTRLFVVDGASGAVWPMPQIVSSSYNVRGLAVMKDANEQPWIYMQDDNGYVYKFDPDEKNYYPNNTKTGINAYAQTGVFDLGGLYDMREPQLYAKVVGEWALRTYFKFDSESGEGTYGDVTLTGGEDTLTTSFTLGASILGGRVYVRDDIDVSGSGSLLQFKFQNSNADESFNIEELVIWMKFIRQVSFR